MICEAVSTPPIPPPTRKHNANCVVCTVCVFDISETAYMVRHDVWEATGLENRGGVLCIGCLEALLGRTLMPEDFPKCIPLNGDHYRSINFKRSSRLMDRMGKTRTEC